MISSFKAVFFDAGGTLLHPFPSVGEIYHRVASRYGYKTDADRLQKKFSEVWTKRDGLGHLSSHHNEKIEKEWWRSLVQEVFSETEGPFRDFEIFFEELYDAFANPEAWRLYPGVLEVLAELKKRGKRLAIVSNWDSRLFKLCEGLGLEDYFEFVLASAVFGASKPSPKIFMEALRRAKVSAAEAVHVGDSLEDEVKGALAAGICPILIDRGPSARRLEGIQTIQKLEELLS